MTFRQIIVSFLLLPLIALNLKGAEWGPEFRPKAFAIENATIISGSGQTLEKATITVRDGRVESVGKTSESKIAPGTTIISGEGLFVYPGWIDAYTLTGLDTSLPRSKTGKGRTLQTREFASPFMPPDDRSGMTPEFQVSDSLDLSGSKAESRRKLGFTTIITAPGGAILTGQGVLASTTGYPRREIIIAPSVGLHVNLKAPYDPAGSSNSGQFSRGNSSSASGTGYPNSMMGVIAHLRQNILDALHHRQLKEYYEKNGGKRVPQDPALETILEALDGKLHVWWQAESEDEIHRALDLSKEFGFKPVIVGGREAYKTVDRLKAENVPVVLRVSHPAKPKVPSKEEFAKRKPDQRVEPLRVLEEKREIWQKQISTASVLDKAGIRFAFCTDGLQKQEQFQEKLRDILEAGLSEDSAIKALSINAAELAGLENRLGVLEKDRMGHLVVMTGKLGDKKAKIRLVSADGILFDFDPPKVFGQSKPTSEKPKTFDEKKSEEKPDSKSSEDVKPKPNQIASAKEDQAQPKESEAHSNLLLEVSTELDADRKVSSQSGGNVFIRNATILTMGQSGTFPRASILIRKGKIEAIGENLEKPADVVEIPAEGLYVMPGMIDTHSHMAIQGGVNETTLSMVPEVRVSDVVNGNDPAIYRALAGGTTTARLLHGSANTIGGQDVIIKLAQGKPGKDLILRDEQRPQGVKFALGENVTRTRGRFPDTRMGVQATIERAFQQGKAYSELWKNWELARQKDPATAEAPPRRDLRLEALSRIVQGDIKIHSHCYRADEILMLLRTAERYNIRVQSLQHVLEGYKVASEIAAHGASASTFSDWWAYKVEAFDAIPANAAILTEAGANAVIKSDDEELVRHLNLEAAKSVKYGSMPEEKALAMVTINAARELGLDHRLGSLEIGKDGDLAIFDAHPLDTFSQCRMTLVNGEIRFQRSSDLTLNVVPKKIQSLGRNPNASKKRVLNFKEDPDNRRVRAFIGARVHPVDQPAIIGGVVIIEGNTIKAVGGPETPIPNGAEVINLEGLDLWPGMIDSGNHVGLYEIGSLRETQDFSDSATFQPELVTSTAIHADSALIPVTRANGILTILSDPNGGLIAGQSSIINLAGWVPSEMVLKEKTALHIRIPGYIPEKDSFGMGENKASAHCGCDAMATDAHDEHDHGPTADDPSPEETRRNQEARQKRTERLEEIAEQFRLAKRYAEAKSHAEKLEDTSFQHDPRMEAMQPYTQGLKPVIFHANHRMEILDALKLAEVLKIKTIISGGQEAWKVADALKAAEVPVLIDGVLQLPRESYDPYDAPYANASKLHAAGVKFAIQSGGGGPDEATSARNLPFEAGTAVAFGLPEEEALKSVTLAPAEILGVSDQLGSITAGKRANLVVSRGSILQATTPVVLLVIDGRVIKPESRHTELAEKYRERLRQVKSGIAPLGVNGVKAK